MVRIDGRDHDQRRKIVDDDHRQHEGAQAARYARSDQRQHAERKGRVGGHRRTPAVGGGVPGVEREVDADRHRHAAEPRQQWHRHPAPLAQLAEVELAPRLEPDDEEEEDHQPVVDPVAQVLRDPAAADADRQHRRPDAVVGGGIDVRPGQRCKRAGEQDDGAARLRAEEAPQRRGEVSRPRGPRRVHDAARLLLGHRPPDVS